MLLTSVFLLLHFYLSDCLEVIAPQLDPNAFQGVINRLPAWVADEFPDIRIGSSKVLRKGTIRISMNTDGQKVLIAESAVDALYGIHYYLRNYCASSISWDGSSFSNGCDRVDGDLSIFLESPPIRFFGNPVTYSYSFVWWKWEQWEPFIDWLALNGFNMFLTPLGQDSIWRDVYLELGIPKAAIDHWLAGPPFQAWQWMGNLQSLGGSPSEQFLRKQLDLNLKIVNRLTSLGIVPVLPTFDGIVPDALFDLFPNATFRRNHSWNKFNGTFALSPTDPLFQKIARLYHKKQQAFYGGVVSNVYSADPFIENFPKQNGKLHHHSESIFAQTAHAVFDGCRHSDPNCVWLVQGWMFQNEAFTAKMAKDFLTAVPKGRLLVLDSFGDQTPLYDRFNNFWGHQFIWCFLHNFGGSLQMHGNLKRIGKAWQQARLSAPNLIGGGLVMEGIHQNYVLYQFAIDTFWSPNRLDVSEWLYTFGRSRYSAPRRVTPAVHKLWTLLSETFYNQPPTTDEHVPVFLYNRPNMDGRIKYWFSTSLFPRMVTAFTSLNATLWGNEMFRRDYTDILRETIQYTLGNRLILRVYESYAIGDGEELEKACQKMDDTFELLDGTSNFDLRPILQAARSWASSEEEANRFERNTKMLFTLWGPKGEIRDYAHREYTGLISGYYRRRWRFFCESLLDARYHFDQKKYDEEVFEFIEKPFIENQLEILIP
ncbi:unnamed protein product, partial [Mesorhabditis belari]|uniref:Alpha-N-acetylglucosaminidase n=1 Tax=Mesorhabditis belari TaxID=2138241 RepID=A0AAF3FFY1_9BILA